MKKALSTLFLFAICVAPAQVLAQQKYEAMTVTNLESITAW